MNQVAKTVETQQEIATLNPMTMLDRAVANGASIEVLTKLMDLQERWEKNTARKEFDAAVAEAKAKIRPVVKNRTGHNSKSYADFAAIAMAIDPVIAEFGLSYRFRTEQSDTRISVTCILSHRAGHSEMTTLSGPADATGSKNAIQAIGSTLTYLQRYSLVQMLGLAAADDDNGKSAADAETISSDQLIELQTLLTEHKAPKDKFLKVMKVESLAEIRVKDFEDAANKIRNYKPPVTK